MDQKQGQGTGKYQGLSPCFLFSRARDAVENADHTSLNVSWDLFCESRKDCQVSCLTQPSECTECETASGLHTIFPGGHKSSVNMKSSLCIPEHGMGVIHMKASNTISSLPGCLRCPCKAADVAQIDLCTRQDPVRASVTCP